MSDAFTNLTTGLSALGNVGSFITSGIQAGVQNKYNKEALQWQKDAFRQTQEREDSAVQRRVADLDAAGLSRSLAAGSAATTASAPVIPPRGATAPNFNSLSQAGQDMLNMMSQRAVIDKTRAEEANINAQRAGTELSNIAKNTENQFLSSRLEAQVQQILQSTNTSASQADLNRALEALKHHDTRIFKQWNVPSTTSGHIKELITAINALRSDSVKEVTGVVQGAVNDQLNKAQQWEVERDRKYEENKAKKQAEADERRESGTQKWYERLMDEMRKNSYLNRER